MDYRKKKSICIIAGTLILFIIAGIFTKQNHTNKVYVTLAGGYPVYDSSKEEIRKTKYRDNIDIDYKIKKEINGYKCYRGFDGKEIRYIPNKAIIDENIIEEYKKVIKPIVIETNGELGHNSKYDKYLNKYTKLDIDKTKSQLDQLEDIIRHIKSLNLEYGDFYANELVNNLKDNKVNCVGIASIQRLLLDKSDITYRIVYENPFNIKTREISKSMPGHVNIEILLGDTWHVFEGTYILNGSDMDDPNTDEIIDLIKRSKIIKEEIRNPSVEHDKNSVDTLYIISSPRKQGKYKDDKIKFMYIPGITLEEYSEFKKNKNL